MLLSVQNQGRRHKTVYLTSIFQNKSEPFFPNQRQFHFFFVKNWRKNEFADNCRRQRIKLGDLPSFYFEACGVCYLVCMQCHSRWLESSWARQPVYERTGLRTDSLILSSKSRQVSPNRLFCGRFSDKKAEQIKRQKTGPVTGFQQNRLICPV